MKLKREMRHMTMAERQAAADDRRARLMTNAFLGVCHKLNADYLAQMQTPAPAIPSEARQLIAILRDETQSKATYERCVAIVGERAP